MSAICCMFSYEGSLLCLCWWLIAKGHLFSGSPRERESVSMIIYWKFVDTISRRPLVGISPNLQIGAVGEKVNWWDFEVKMSLWDQIWSKITCFKMCLYGKGIPMDGRCWGAYSCSHNCRWVRYSAYRLNEMRMVVLGPLKMQNTFLPRCMECRCRLAMKNLSVCPSVKLCIVTKWKKAMFRFYIIRRNVYPSFLRMRMVGGGDPFYLKFWVNRPALERNHRFWTDNRS